MKNLKIALLQLMPGNSLEENLAKGADACKKAKKMGADIALFPEMWSSGYKISEDIEELKTCLLYTSFLSVSWSVLLLTGQKKTESNRNLRRRKTDIRLQ